MDVHSKETRSYNMSRIRGKCTMPEEIVRKYLFRHGFRYRKNVRQLPGCPDIVLPKYKTLVFVNGCFWHVHEGCSKFVWPSSNKDFWREKLLKNKKRDQENFTKLSEMGWKIIVVWECELRDFDSRLTQLIKDINKQNNLKSGVTYRNLEEGNPNF
ncbi:MAG: very short patch repair endonuclease [Desulfotomaculaceae bacterium]